MRKQLKNHIASYILISHGNSQPKTSMKKYNITQLYMSYSNGRLPSSSTTNQQQRGLPGVGFKLTDDGNYDIENKKLRNVAEPQSNSDATTKKYIDNNFIKKDGSNQMTGNLNIGDNQVKNLKAPTAKDGACTKKYVDDNTSNHLKKDGSDKMSGILNMDNNRIESVGPGRHGTADALTHVQLEAFYFDLNTNSGNIEAQNSIDMKNEKIVNLATPAANSDAATKKIC